MNNTFEIRLDGMGISPATVKIKDLTDIISSFEEIMIHLIKREHPDIDTDEIVIGLSEVLDGSAKFRFQSFLPSILATFITFTHAIANNDYKYVPLEPIRKMFECSKKLKCNIEFRKSVDSKEPLAKITPDTKITAPEDQFIEGQTTIYGVIERVGGKDPTVMVTLLNGQTVYCKVDAEFAKKIASRLYNCVGLIGTARWDLESYKIESFKILDITNYEYTPISGSISELSAMIGKYWSNEQDVVKAISELRGE